MRRCGLCRGGTSFSCLHVGLCGTTVCILDTMKATIKMQVNLRSIPHPIMGTTRYGIVGPHKSLFRSHYYAGDLPKVNQTLKVPSLCTSF